MTHPAYRYRGDSTQWEIRRVIENRLDSERGSEATICAAGPGEAMQIFRRDHDPAPGLYEVQPWGEPMVPDQEAYRQIVKVRSCVA